MAPTPVSPWSHGTGQAIAGVRGGTRAWLAGREIANLLRRNVEKRNPSASAEK